MSFKDWEDVLLGDLVKIKGGKRLPKGEVLIKDKTSHPYIRVRDLSDRRYLELDNQIEYLDEEVFNSISRYTVNEGDIVISIVGTIGLVSIIGKTLDGANLTENCVKLIELKNVNRDYLYYYLTSIYGKREFEKGTVGAVQAKLPIKNIQQVSIKLPNLSQQKAIADILSSLDDKIEVNNQMNETLEEMAQALFKRWFVDFEFPNEEGKPYKSSGGEMVESELGMIPKRWNIKLASEVVDVKDGTHASPKVVNEGYPLITSKHINGDRLRIEEANLISETDYVEVNKRSKVDTGDILISMIGTVGLLYYVQDLDVNFAIKNLGLFKTSKTVEMQEYIYLYLKQTSMKNYIECRLAGTTQKYISLTELRKIPVLLPTCDLLHTFKEKIEPLLKMKQENINQNQSLVNIRSTLLPKLMSGEIRVSDLN